MVNLGFEPIVFESLGDLEQGARDLLVNLNDRIDERSVPLGLIGGGGGSLMYCLGAWNRVMFVMILDDLIVFTCILRIYEGSELVLLGAEVACTDFIHLGYVWRFLGEH